MLLSHDLLFIGTSEIRSFTRCLHEACHAYLHSFHVGHYETSDNLVSQSLHAFSLRHLITSDFLAPFLRLLVTAARWLFELTQSKLYKLVAELAEWLVYWAPKLASRVRCSTRSSL